MGEEDRLTARTDATVRNYLDAFATADPAEIAAHVTDDFVNEHAAALGTGCIGRDEYLRRLPTFLADFRGVRYEVEDVIAAGGRAAAAYVLHAHYQGHPVTVRGVMRFELRDDRIAQRVDYWDALGFLRQIGQA